MFLIVVQSGQYNNGEQNTKRYASMSRMSLFEIVLGFFFLSQVILRYQTFSQNITSAIYWVYLRSFSVYLWPTPAYKRFCLVFLYFTQTILFNENCVHFCLNNTKGDVDLEERDGFLGFSISNMNPLDHIYSLSKGEMLLRYFWLFKETCNQTLWFIQLNGRLTNKTKWLWVSINKRWINR